MGDDKINEAPKHTPGPWRLACDAQGPCMVMHPTLKGVAIATLTDASTPMNGFHSPTVDKPEPCAERDTTYHPERVANARLIAAAPDLLDAAQFALEQIQRTFQLVQLTPSLDDGLCTAKDDLRDAINKALGKE
jgi:hypothetical protein